MTAPPPSDLQVEDVLSRFPGPVTLPFVRQDFWRAFSLLIFPAFAILSAVLIADGGHPVGAILFPLLTIIAGIRLLPASRGLTLDANGFQQRVFLLSLRSLWRESTNFTVVPILSPYSGRRVTMAIWYHDQAREDWWFGSLLKLGTPYNAGVMPVDGLTIEELTNLMTHWRERALKDSR
jgi:hypothetical protein